jgi:hypothetical protein
MVSIPQCTLFYLLYAPVPYWILGWVMVERDQICKEKTQAF